MSRDMQGDRFVFMSTICATPRCGAHEAHRDETALAKKSSMSFFARRQQLRG